MSAAEISSVLKNSIANLPESSYYEFKFSFFFEANSNVRLNFQALPQAINDRPLCLDKIRADILRKGPKIFSALAYRDPQAALLERSGCEF